jgi:hypothetical protein
LGALKSISDDASDEHVAQNKSVDKDDISNAFTLPHDDSIDARIERGKCMEIWKISLIIATSTTVCLRMIMIS